MSNSLRKFRRKTKPHYTCCGRKMQYKESHRVYICEVCGKEKRQRKKVGLNDRL